MLLRFDFIAPTARLHTAARPFGKNPKRFRADCRDKLPPGRRGRADGIGRTLFWRSSHGRCALRVGEFWTARPSRRTLASFAVSRNDSTRLLRGRDHAGAKAVSNRAGIFASRSFALPFGHHRGLRWLRPPFCYRRGLESRLAAGDHLTCSAKAGLGVQVLPWPHVARLISDRPSS